jgi:hypothetical protein
MPLVALLLLVAGLCLAPMAESDLFFRLKVGEGILRDHAIAGRNLFSFTFPDHPDIDPAWLFDVAAAALYRLGGFPAVVLGKTALVLAIFAGAYHVCRRRGAGPVAAALALAAAALVMRERLVERPHLFSLAGEVAVLAALATPARLWALIPATALWANLHAGAFLGPVLLLLAGLGALIDARGKEVERSLFAAGAACLAALLVTPIGLGLFRYLRFHVGIFAVHPVDEFRSASWISDAPAIVFALVAAGAAIVARPRLRELLPALALGLLAAGSARFLADFALVAAPLVAVGLTRAVPLLAHRAAPAVATAALALAVVPSVHRPIAIGLDESQLPLEAIRFVRARGLDERMYNDFEIGAFLLWEGYPRRRVFVDPRLPAYPLSFHRLLGEPHLDRRAWDAALDGFGVTTALLAYAGINHRISWWDPARWALVYRAHDARVFVRRLPRWQPLIAEREIPATFGFTAETGATTLPLDEPPPGSPVPACEWQRRLGDLLFELRGESPAVEAYRRALATPDCLAPAHAGEAAAWVGAVLLKRGEAATALPYLERAPEDLATLTNRALALEAVGRAVEATAVWSIIAERARGTELGERAAARGRRP